MNSTTVLLLLSAVIFYSTKTKTKTTFSSQPLSSIASISIASIFGAGPVFISRFGANSSLSSSSPSSPSSSSGTSFSAFAFALDPTFTSSNTSAKIKSKSRQSTTINSSTNSNSNNSNNTTKKQASSKSSLTDRDTNVDTNANVDTNVNTNMASSIVSASMRRAAPALVKKLKNVVIVGGTHGNEYTGVWIIKSLESEASTSTTSSSTSSTTTRTRLEALQKELYPSLNLSTLLANPQAHLENKRFIHQDLNRQFTRDALLQKLQEVDEGNEECNDNDNDSVSDNDNGGYGDGLPRSVESLRALEINALLGPKFVAKTTNDNDENHEVNESTSADVVVDLHTTTTNMGVTIIVAEGDPIMTRAAAYVMSQLNNVKGGDRNFDKNSDRNTNTNGSSDICGGDSNDDVNVNVKCLLHTHPNRGTRPNVASTGRHGFTIEVGPVPQGVLRHDAVEKTEEALFALLEYLELYNSDEGRLRLDSILRAAYAADSGRADGDGDGDGDGAGVVAGEVPCFKSARARKEGEMSGKIIWPTSDDNPNFPSLMVHKDLQDRDFELIRKGDPLFVDLQGNVHPYDGSHGSPVYLMFVNEGGYYYKSSGTGIAVAVKAYFDLETGLLVREEVGDDSN